MEGERDPAMAFKGEPSLLTQVEQKECSQQASSVVTDTHGGKK